MEIPGWIVIRLLMTCNKEENTMHIRNQYTN
jgi:hypothetical protein